MIGHEVVLTVHDRRVAALVWGSEDGLPVLALHGWLDNAASFARLAPKLAGVRLIAVDLPGHGRSEHRPEGCANVFAQWLVDVTAVLDALEWPHAVLLGHSMGAGIATLVAGALPDRVTALALLEGFGPLSVGADETASRLGRAVTEQLHGSRRSAPVYSSPAEAVERVRAARRDLDSDGARLLAERGLVPVKDGWQFGHDPRLRAPSLVRFTEAQVRNVLAAIRCPTLVVRADRGWPFDAEQVRQRIACVSDVEVATLEGGHHVHLAHPERVAAVIQRFLDCLPEGRA
jgi:pimeloyl-ACP methyl ester carboxylesterase